MPKILSAKKLSAEINKPCNIKAYQYIIKLACSNIKQINGGQKAVTFCAPKICPIRHTKCYVSDDDACCI